MRMVARIAPGSLDPAVYPPKAAAPATTAEAAYNTGVGIFDRIPTAPCCSFLTEKVVLNRCVRSCTERSNYSTDCSVPTQRRHDEAIELTSTVSARTSTFSPAARTVTLARGWTGVGLRPWDWPGREAAREFLAPRIFPIRIWKFKEKSTDCGMCY